MSFEYLADPSRPAWAGLLPGKPEAYFLSKGEGEHAKLFTYRVFVQLPDGQQVSRRLEEGDFGFVPAGLLHAYRVEQAAQMMGVASGGFERFFQQMGAPADTIDPDSPPFVPDFPRMQAAAQTHRMQFRPDFTWPDA
jgi:quercetin 2,3-dioxygenase